MLAEELGFVGVLVVIGLFSWLVIRAFGIAKEAIINENYYSALLSQGIGIWFGIQGIMNMGVNMGLLPTKGLTLPLLSYGGSSILANIVGLAILLRIDWENRRGLREYSLVKSNKKILIIAGGTGGHIYPGIAIADYLKAKGFIITWLGTKQGMENKLIENKPYQKAMIDITGVRGKSILSWLKLPFTLMVACTQCAKIIQEEKPDIVIAMGGYVSFPGGLMARLMLKPLIVHEQNSIPGLTNKLLAIIATHIYSAFPIKLMRSSQKIGNPVRDSIRKIEKPDQRFKNRKGPLRLLVVGGSLGAKFFNEMIPESIQQINIKKDLLLFISLVKSITKN